MMIKKDSFFLICLFVVAVNATAQSPYVLNGSATQDNCHCYTLTAETFEQSGSIWNKNKTDLRQPFDYFFNVFLGCQDAEGADGIVFVLQPVSTSLGTAGGGLGFLGIIPSLGVTIDTWQNVEHNDPSYDHIDIQANGDIIHGTINDLTGPVPALASSDNIEDCEWHVLEINWAPADHMITVSMDGIVRLSLQKDIIASIFNNDPMVFWGFTSSTGGADNLQRMCTSLNANFVLAPHDNTCIGMPLRFIDSSVSFGAISQWYWNFGDGTTSSEKKPPAHLYSSPGIYNVTLNVLGGEGCLSDTTKEQITIGSYPVADFNINEMPLCTNENALFADASTLAVGTKNYWYWNFGNGKKSNEQNPPPVRYNMGNYTVKFFVRSAEGCASDTIEKSLAVVPVPGIDFIKADACKGTPVQFTATHSDTVRINKWYWDFDDNSFSRDSSVLHTYLNGGKYHVSLVAQANNGCISDSINKPVTIYATNAYAGKDTIIPMGYPYQLKGSGGDSYTWSPSAGLDDPFIAKPTATLYNDITYTLTASTDFGCATTDSVQLKVVKGPDIYVPSAFTPNGDGLNDRFNIIPVGIKKIVGFEIMNRLGQRVYSSMNSSDGWDGNLNGIPQPPGTYVWMVAGRTVEGVLIKKQGTVALIR